MNMRIVLANIAGLLLRAALAGATDKPLPPLPETSGKVAIPAQDTASLTGRTVMVYLRYPEGRLDAVKPTTGLMLSLHNWGGNGFTGAPKGETLAQRYNVVAIGVDYLQSGDKPADPAPYDFGFYQAGDVLRALHYVIQSLDERKIGFDRTRIYATGGSGGGNVALMAAKFAPQAFACVVDLSGMASLTDDIAYHLPGGSGLDARYSRERTSPAYLAPGMQEIRDPGHPAHLALLGMPKNGATLVSVHGQDDTFCLWEDKKRVVNALQNAGVKATLHTITKKDIDGTLIRDSGHAIGDRTELVQKFAGQYLTPGSAELRRLKGGTDFERRTVLTFPVRDGACVVSFAKGGPELTLTFRGAPAPGR